MTAMQGDKKVMNKKLRLVLPTEIGAVVVRDDIKSRFIKEAYDF